MLRLGRGNGCKALPIVTNWGRHRGCRQTKQTTYFSEKRCAVLRLPTSIMTRLEPFAPVFSRRVWRHVPPLVGGAILAPQRRMVSTALRVMGLSRCVAFSTYYRVLNRAVWSSVRTSRILLGLLVAAFAPEGPLAVGIDAALERRRGPQIAAAGI